MKWRHARYGAVVGTWLDQGGQFRVEQAPPVRARGLCAATPPRVQPEMTRSIRAIGGGANPRRLPPTRGPTRVGVIVTAVAVAAGAFRTPMPLGLGSRPYDSALSRLLLSTSPSLAPPRCHPDRRPSAIPKLGITYYACLAVGSVCRVGLSGLTQQVFRGQIFQKSSRTHATHRRLVTSTASHAHHTDLARTHPVLV